MGVPITSTPKSWFVLLSQTVVDQHLTNCINQSHGFSCISCFSRQSLLANTISTEETQCVVSRPTIGLGATRVVTSDVLVAGVEELDIV